jgi:hypothetical protein
MGHRHSVDISMDGPHGRVIVDGLDLANAVQAITWQSDARSCPRMELELRIIDVTKLSSKDTEILIPDATAEALIALGWAPPDVTKGDPPPGG